MKIDHEKLAAAVARARRVCDLAETDAPDDEDELDVVALAALVLDAVTEAPTADQAEHPLG